MTTLAADKGRDFAVDPSPLFNSVPVIASDIVYQGAAVGESASLGLARPLVAGDAFLGFAEGKSDNSAGGASAKDVTVRQRGVTVLEVVGVTSTADVGATVYASDDDTFTLTLTSNTAIGKITRWISGTKCEVYFEALAVRSL